MSKTIVAIIGSPNVGKSTIFNRIIGDKRAIVDDEAGITRDRLYGTAKWLNKSFTLIDTGGIEIADRPFQEQIRIQANIAIDEADIIIFATDGKLGVTKDDRMIARMLQKSKKPIILIVNKIDGTLRPPLCRGEHAAGPRRRRSHERDPRRQPVYGKDRAVDPRQERQYRPSGYRALYGIGNPADRFRSAAADHAGENEGTASDARHERGRCRECSL